MHYFLIMRKKNFVQAVMFICTVLILIIMVLWGENRSLRNNAPLFSRKSGFYEENFYLSIEAKKGAIIYYTLDGSIPTNESNIYTEPLLIEDATVHDNVYCMNTDTSTGFYSDLIREYMTADADPKYRAPDFTIDKCTVVRAMAVYEDGVVSDVATGSYYIGGGYSTSGYNGCKFISLVTDPSNLFDEEKGIYVTGKKFKWYMDDGKIANEWRWWDANYRQVGPEWERNEYEGIESFGVPLFGNAYIPKSISLTSGGNHTVTQFCDYMITQRTGELNFPSLLYEPYVLFLNGEYWGFYWLAEKYDEKYLEYYYDVDPQQVVMIKNDKLEIGDDRDYSLFEDMVDYISSNDMSLSNNYAKACELIDMDNFIDYYATMIYIARCDDWPDSNTALWRTKTSNGSTYSDGKWRWLMFDCNSTCMREDDEKQLINHDTLAYVMERDSVFASLWNNNSFRSDFVERLFYIADKCFDAEEMNQFIEQYNERMIPILSKSWDRFYGSDNVIEQKYYDMMESHRVFFENRRETVEKWFVTNQ